MDTSIIQLIWRRELRDLLRDRRTVFMIFVLPLALYPLLVIVVLLFLWKEITHVSKVGIHGEQYLPPAKATSTELDYSPLLVNHAFPSAYADGLMEGRLEVVSLPSDDRRPLDSGEVDVLLLVPADFWTKLDAAEQARFEIYYREGDGQSRLAKRRLAGVLHKWMQEVRRQRFLRKGLPANFDRPVELHYPQEPAPSMTKQIGYELKEMLAKCFPFLVIMWALAGALHPAIDLTAGEKERGTLETLLLSPASRGEIVCGKFLAVWAFSAATALWNLAWIGGATCFLGQLHPDLNVMSVSALLGSAAVSILISALFSAVSMALGSYARGTKEGQYYLIPVFIVTMPLIFLSLVPGVDLDWFYSLVPITGACLLMQKLLAGPAGPTLWAYSFLVLASLVICCALSLRWAVAQFRRESVLFRDSEGISLSRALRRLFTRTDIGTSR
jgi:sodium transport system permease protein